MIQFKNLKQYTHIVDGLRFPQNPKNPFLLIYFSENSTFLDDYEKLNLKLIDFKIIAIPSTKIPRTFLIPNIRKLYREKGLFAYSLQSNLPFNKNIVIDLSQYLITLDNVYNPSNYRQRVGFLIKDALFKSLIKFSDEYQKVFLYSINNTKNFNGFINRKIFPIIQDLKNEKVLFNDMLLNITGGASSNYRLLVKNKKFNIQRIVQYIKTIKTSDIENEIQKDVNIATDKVMKRISGDINSKNKIAIKSAVNDYLSKNVIDLNKVISKKPSTSDIQQIATTSILFKVSGNIKKSKEISKNIPEDKKLQALKVVDKNYGDELLKPYKTKSLSIDPIITIYNIPDMIDKKSPEHVFEKRQIDFEINLKNDISNSFKVLESKEIPLQFDSFEIVEKPQREGELYKSDINIIKVSLSDDFNNKHEVSIEIPKIDPSTGTFRINGRKKCLINQIVQCPITFPKPGQSRFESSYAVFRIESKKLRREQYLETYLGSYKLPFSILMFYSFGFEKTLNQFEIKYEIINRKIKKTEFGCKIDEKTYILFNNIDSQLKEEFVQSFIRAKINEYEIKKEFGTHEYFESLILKITGRLNSTFVINSILQNVIDPVVKQILITQQLPFELGLVMQYMAKKVVDKFVIDRNDLSNQRIRNSEVLVALAQKQILSAYTVYKEQILSGNKQANFTLSPTKVLSDFIGLEIVTDMEYANPIEEMGTMTRVSPVGKIVGGIPDKRAISTNARNVHPSYFGNIDPLDTPEGGNIGLVQQLTIDAHITSARGLLLNKKIINDENSGMLSTTTCMVPFLENNDGARVIMLSNQSRQMLPLKNPKPPIIQSGYESVLTNNLSNNFIKRSTCTGKIEKITDALIKIKCTNGTQKEIDISPVHLRSGSGKNTLSVFKPIVKKGQNIKSNDIIAEGSCLSNGSISLGRSLCVAIMPYEGYNFEDGIVINEKLIQEDLLTSLHGIEENVLLSEKDRLLYIAEIGKNTVKGEPLLKRTMGEIEELIGFEEDEFTDISEGQMIHKSPGGKIINIEVFSNVPEDKFPKLKVLIGKTNKQFQKPKSKKYTIKGSTIQGVLIKFRLEQELPIGLGDKLCNRYGNKGIVSLVEKDENMPRTPNGDRIDVIINPIGLIGRMNLGQLYELYCGLISKELGKRIEDINTKKQLTDLLKKILPRLDKSKGQKYSLQSIMKIDHMSDKKFKDFIDRIKEIGFFPLIIPPFKAPKYQDILDILKILKLKTGYNLYLPKYRMKTKNPVPYGYMYISKLEHIGSEKIYARSTGPSTRLGQPTAGRRRFGGQRLGELDSYSLLSYNCTATLAELMGPLSDDYVTRDEILSEVIQTGNANYKPAKINPARDLLNSYFVSLMLSKD